MPKKRTTGKLTHPVRLWSLLCLLITPLLHAETLTILNWEEYLSPEIIARWESRTGHKIKQIYFDNDQQRDSMLLSYQGGVIDVAVIDETVAKTYGDHNILAPIDTTKALPNLKHLDDFWGGRCSRYGVPYMYGTIGIAYRKDKIAKAPSSWWDLLQPDEALRGHVSLLNEPADTLLPALLARGHSNNTADKAALKQAYLDTEKLLPYILTFEYPITYLSTLPDDEDLHMALVYGGDHHTHNALQESNHWDYVIPREGTVVWTDCFGVLSSSRKKELALNFINFLNEPEIAALNSEEIYFATPNKSAKAFQSADFLSDKSINPGESLIKNSRFYDVLDTDNLQTRHRLIQSLMVKYEAQ